MTVDYHPKFWMTNPPSLIRTVRSALVRFVHFERV
jgi:hypothetical protein